MNAIQQTKTIGKHLQRILPVVFFVLLLIVGWVLHDDYGGYTDEITHLKTGAIQYKMLLSLFMPQDQIPAIPIIDLQQLPPLEEYINRFYGEAAMLPTILIAAIPGVKFSDSAFLNFRRFYTFLNFFLAIISFYQLLRLRFVSSYIALLGSVMLVLSPRFFAESFYNSKDIVFFSWFLISLSVTAAYLFRPGNGKLLFFAVSTALAANARVNGLILYPAFLALITIDSIREHKPFWQSIRNPLLAVILSLGIYWMISPFLWQQPIENLLGSLNFATNQVGVSMADLATGANVQTIGNAELFMGELIAPKDIWYYLPVWIGITTPLLYLILFITGICFLLKKTCRKTHDRNWLFDIFIAGLFFLLQAVIILSHATLYNGWRHAYFLYGPLLYLAVLGLSEILQIDLPGKLNLNIKNAIVLGLCGASFITTGIWMLRNHPLDFVYFNEISRKQAEQFSRDYWGVSSKSCMLYLAANVSDEPIRLAASNTTSAGAIDITWIRLPQTVQDHFELFWQTRHADYLCLSYTNLPGNDYPVENFEIIKTFAVDGYAVSSAYHRIQADE